MSVQNLNYLLTGSNIFSSLAFESIPIKSSISLAGAALSLSKSFHFLGLNKRISTVSIQILSYSLCYLLVPLLDTRISWGDLSKHYLQNAGLISGFALAMLFFQKSASSKNQEIK